LDRVGDPESRSKTVCGWRKQRIDNWRDGVEQGARHNAVANGRNIELTFSTATLRQPYPSQRPRKVTPVLEFDGECSQLALPVLGELGH
jgi:hypothetical protein